MSAVTALLLGTIMNPQKVQVLFAMVLLPMTMLGCVYYPWSALDNIRWLQIASLFNPLVYVSEACAAPSPRPSPHAGVGVPARHRRRHDPADLGRDPHLHQARPDLIRADGAGPEG